VTDLSQNVAVDTFEAIAASLAGRDGVTVGGGKGFGAGALQVDGRIFAMPSGDGLALKLPRDRVTALLAAGMGTPFDAGKGRPMKEWVVVPWRPDIDALALAEEALAFVGSRPAALK
jgi:hypothetical protein